MKRLFWTTVAAAMAVAVAGAAVAAPVLTIQGAVARVTVIPEARSDIVVVVARTNPRFPLRIVREANGVRVEGRLGVRLQGCGAHLGKPVARIWGGDDIAWNDMPQLIVRAPMNVVVGAGGAVFGVVGRAFAVDLSASGCGDWTVADVAGPLRVRASGSGDVRTGAARSADVRLAGSGDVSLRRIDNGLTASTAGSGDIAAGAVNGTLEAHVAGSGSVRVGSGQVSAMTVAVAGSGDVTFGGVARTLDARIVGSGDVRAARVTGLVSRRVVGSGDVRVGG